MEFSSHRDFVTPNVSAADCFRRQQSAAKTFGVTKSLWLENSIEPFQNIILNIIKSVR